MKQNYYRDKLQENKNNIKQAWSILNNNIGRLENKGDLPDLIFKQRKRRE